MTLWSENLVITDVSVEILTSRIGRKSLGAKLNPIALGDVVKVESPLRIYDAKMSRWLNKWIVPLLVAFVMLVALAIAAFVSYGVHLLH
jgi:hypothetical protein